MKAFGPFVVCQIYLILNLVNFTVSILKRKGLELPLNSFENKNYLPTSPYDDVPNDVQEVPKMVVELDNAKTNGGKDLVTSNELKEVIKLLDMLDGLGTRSPTQNPISQYEEQPTTKPVIVVQPKTNPFNKIKSISEKITHNLEYLSKLVGDYSGIVSAQNETVHGVLKDIHNKVSKYHRSKLAKQKLQKQIPLSIKITSLKADESNTVCRKGELYKSAMDELAIVTNRLKDNIGMVLQNINKRSKNVRINNNNKDNDYSNINTKSKEQAIFDLWDDIVKFYDAYQNKINELVYDLVINTSTRSNGDSKSDIELCKIGYETFIKALYSDVSKLTERINKLRADINNVTEAPVQLIVDNGVNNKGDALIHVDLNDGSEIMTSLKKLMDLHKNQGAGRSNNPSDIVYNQIHKEELPYFFNQQRNQPTRGANYVSLKPQCILLMTRFLKSNMNQANVDDILASLDNSNNPHPQVVCPHSDDYKQFIVKYFLFKMFINDHPNCKLFFDNPRDMIRSIDTSCYHKDPEVTTKPCKKPKHDNNISSNDELFEISEVPEISDVPDESKEKPHYMEGFDVPMDKLPKLILPFVDIHKHPKPKEKVGDFIKYKIPVKLLGGGKCIGSQKKPEDIREELKLYFELLNHIYASMNGSPTEKESLSNLRALSTLNRICLSKAKGDIELNYMIKTPAPNKYFTVKLRIPFHDFRESTLAELRDSERTLRDIEDIYKKVITNCNVVSLSPELEHITDITELIKAKGVLVSVFLSGVDTYTSTAKLDCRQHLVGASGEDQSSILSRELRSLDGRKQNNTKINKPLIRPAHAPLRFNRIW